MPPPLSVSTWSDSEVESLVTREHFFPATMEIWGAVACIMAFVKDNRHPFLGLRAQVAVTPSPDPAV